MGSRRTDGGAGRVVMFGWLDAVAGLVAERILAAGGDAIAVAAEAPDGWPAAAGFQVRRDRASVAAAVRDLQPECLIHFCVDPIARSGRLALANAAMRAAASVGVPLMIHWGSAAAYPRSSSDGRPWSETDTFDGPADVADQSAADRAAREFASVHSHTEVYVFRVAPTIGPRNSGAIEDMLRMPLVSRLQGDPVMQFLHEEDAAEVLWRAVQEGEGGTYNVAADGLMRLSEVCRALSRPSVSLPAGVAWGLACASWLLRRAPSPRRQLRWSSGMPILDNTRLKTHFGTRPRHTGREALAAARAQVLSG